MTTLQSHTETTRAVPTRALLACGILAGPLYIIIGVIQIFIREGFDPTRHALSLMSTGDLGWIQIFNFIASGVLIIAGAVGMRRVMRSGSGGTWGPLLLCIYGVSLIAAGVFTADPMDGFPPGTPPGPPEAVSWHGMLHFFAGAIGFFAAVASCFVLTRRYIVLRQSGWALYSAATGVLFLAAFFAIASGSAEAWVILAFTAAVVLLWAWISAVSAQLMTTIADPRSA